MSNIISQLILSHWNLQATSSLLIKIALVFILSEFIKRLNKPLEESFEIAKKLDLGLRFLCESKEQGYTWLYQNQTLNQSNTYGQYLPKHLTENGVHESEVIEILLHFKQRGFIKEHENGQIKILISGREFWNNGNGGFANEAFLQNRTTNRNNWTWQIAIASFVIVILTLILDICGLFNPCN